MRTKILLLFVCFGCSSRPRPASPPEADRPVAESLLERADTQARAGASLAAEQYLLAAWDAGASTGQVLPRLLEICLAAGRLQNLRSHVARAREDDPDDAMLGYLEAEVLYALGQNDESLAALNALYDRGEVPQEALYLSGRVLIETGRDPGRGVEYLREFLALQPRGPTAARARALISRGAP